MRNRALYMLLAQHRGHEITVKERDANLAAPFMQLVCTKCSRVLTETAPSRSLLKASMRQQGPTYVAQPIKPDRAPRPLTPEFDDDYLHS